MAARIETIPIRQTAIIQDAYGQATISHNSPVPALQSGCVLIKTVAVALNPSDYKMGTAFPSPGATIGTDFAGRIIAKHPSVASDLNLEIGDAVCGISHGSNPGDHQSGAFCQYVLAQAELLLRVPEQWLPMHKAAAIGTALFTACAALWGSLRLSATPGSPASGSTGGGATPVLVYGGSTACGTMAIQLLALSGFNPIATCSPHNFELVKSFGAEAVFDYSSPAASADIRKNSRGRLRHALDCITDQASVACCYEALGRPGGRYSSLEHCKPEWQTRKVVQADFVMSLEVLGKAVKLEGDYNRQANPDMHKLAYSLVVVFQQLLDQQKLRPHPVHCIGHSFDSILEGLEDLKSGSVSGKKLVILIG